LTSGRKDFDPVHAFILSGDSFLYLTFPSYKDEKIDDRLHAFKKIAT
jgi:hypothetical protein